MSSVPTAQPQQYADQLVAQVIECAVEVDEKTWPPLRSFKDGGSLDTITFELLTFDESNDPESRQRLGIVLRSPIPADVEFNNEDVAAMLFAAREGLHQRTGQPWKIYPIDGVWHPHGTVAINGFEA